MSNDPKQKSLGEAIDEIIAALQGIKEANRQVAIRAACDHLGISDIPTPSSHVTPAGAHIASGALPTPSSTSTPLDIRTLKNQKNPSSAQEMACIVAYYLQYVAPINDRKQSVTASDLDHYFRQAFFPLPSHIKQLLPDAKSAGYFDSAERGSYKLNPVGYNLVVHSLPRSLPSTSSQSQKKAAKRKKRKAKKTKRA